MFKNFFFLLFIFSFFATAIDARFEIEINELSGRKLPPIAVPRFVNTKGHPSGGVGSKMTAIIKKDIRMTGIFSVMDESSFPRDDYDVARIDFAKWRALEAQALVKGIVDKVGKDTVVEIRLYDVSGQKMLAGKRYTVTNKNYIDAAHRFMDELLLALTDVRGPFESKVAASCGKPFRRHIFSFDIDGERMQRVTSGEKNNISPTWSPDGRYIAYTSFTSRYPEVHITNGSKGWQVTHFMTTTITPNWTPDGSRLVVASSRTSDMELYLVSLSGRVIGQLTSSPNIDLAPSFSPDGRFVFASERAGDLHLFTSSLGGGGATRMTFVGYQNDQPDWSPDGTKIVFAGREHGVFDIFVMGSDGSNILRLTRGEGSNESPTWGPDSRYISFSSSRGGIFIMDEDGNTQTLIPKTGGCINSDWGPWLTKEESRADNSSTSSTSGSNAGSSEE